MRTLYLLFISFIITPAFAQNNTLTAFLIDYTHQFPKFGLHERFNSNAAIGIHFIKEKENHFFYGVDAHYMFGDNVKDSMILDGISTENGVIIAGNGNNGNVLLYERGLSTHLIFGYAYHPRKESDNGIYLSGGLGYLQHKIHIETKNEYIPQLTEEYKKGYDRFSSGLSTKWNADYFYFSKKGDVQFFSGVEMIYAFTKNQRNYLFDKMLPTENKLRHDILIGMRLGIIIPISRKNKEEFHYF